MRRNETEAAPRRLSLYVLVVPPLLLVLDTVAAMVRGWSPLASRVDLLAVGAIGATTLAALAAWLAPSLRRRACLHWRGIVSGCAGMLVAIAIGEAGLLALGDRIERAPFHGHPRGLRQIFEPNIAGASPVAHFTVNSLGLRGAEEPGEASTFRILCLGGSTTEDVYLDDAKTWTRRIGDELNASGTRRYWSASAGRSGFATVEHLRFLESSSSVAHFDAVVVLAGINDLARFVWGKPADRVAGKVEPLWQRSRILALAKRVWSARVGPGNLVMDREALFVRDEQMRRAEGNVIAGEVDVTPALAGFRARLREIVAAGRRRGLTVVLADQPTLFRDDLTPEEERRLWFLRREDGTYLPARLMRSLMDQFNEVTAEVAAETQAPLVRLSGLNGDSRYYYDDCHFTEEGAEEVARRIAGGVAWDSLPLGKVRREPR